MISAPQLNPDRTNRDVRLIAESVSRADAEKERDLARKKWFDYRFMSPVEATEKFVEAYQKCFRMQYSRNISTEESEGKTGTRAQNWRSNSRELVSFWKARQFADELGVTYDHFATCALDLLMARGWKHIPRPNQLYGKNRDLIADEVRLRWLELQDTRPPYSYLPQYMARNSSNLPSQADYQDWLVDFTKRKHGDPRIIARVCFNYGMLAIERATAEFGADRVQQGREFAEEHPAISVVPDSGAPYRTEPSCFGILHAFAADAHACRACKYAAKCALMSDAAKNFAIKKTGSENPVDDRRRRMSRERVQRHRARAAEAKNARQSVSCHS